VKTNPQLLGSPTTDYSDDWLPERGGFELAVSREIRGSQEDAQNRRDIPRMIELGEKCIAFPSRLIFAPAASHRFSSTRSA
jgi:hypothetical protein